MAIDRKQTRQVAWGSSGGARKFYWTGVLSISSLKLKNGARDRQTRKTK